MTLPPAGSHVFVDTNVLLTATTPARPLHRQARSVFEQWPLQGIQLFFSGQIVREYLVVATRPTPENGLGLTLHDGIANLEAFRRRCVLLDETRAVSETLVRLLAKVPCTGKQIHDANVVATAHHHGVPYIVTANAADFERFAAEVGIWALASLPRP